MHICDLLPTRLVINTVNFTFISQRRFWQNFVVNKCWIVFRGVIVFFHWHARFKLMFWLVSTVKISSSNLIWFLGIDSKVINFKECYYSLYCNVPVIIINAPRCLRCPLVIQILIDVIISQSKLGVNKISQEIFPSL